QPTFVIYEVKISRSDFNADVNRGKYLKYLSECNQLYFAAPAGIIKINEVPDGTGLIVRGDKGWQTVKSAPGRAHELDVRVLLKLLMRGYERRMIEWKQYDRLKLLEYKGLKEASFAHGIKIARDLENAAGVIQLAEEIKDKVAEVLGKNYSTVWDAVYSLKSDVDNLFSQKRYSAEVLKLVRIVEMLFQGSRFFADGVPSHLRDLANELEAKFSKDKTE
ncbi:unnamed protein product, partial [marine sediment metagenome]